MIYLPVVTSGVRGRLVTGSHDQRVCVLSLDAVPLMVYDNAHKTVTALAVLSAGRLAARCGDGSVLFWPVVDRPTLTPRSASTAGSSAGAGSGSGAGSGVGAETDSASSTPPVSSNTLTPAPAPAVAASATPAPESAALAAAPSSAS